MMNFDVSGLLEPQKEHAVILRDSLEVNGRSVDTSTMGTGKTYVGSALARFMANFHKMEIVVICPKSVIRKWNETLQSFGVTPKLVINYEKLARGNTKWLKYRRPTKEERKDGIERMMLAVLKFKPNTFIILDESHKCRGVSSLHCGMLMAVRRQGFKHHLMSATQAKDPLDMRAFGYAVGLHNGTMKEYKKFCINSGAEWKGHHGAMYFDDESDSARLKMAEVHHYLYNGQRMASRLTRHDFKGIFRNNHIIAEAYDMGPNSDKIQEAYDVMHAELARLEDQLAKYKEHVLAILIAARRRVEMYKVPSMVEVASDSFDEGNSPIIFVNFAETIQVIKSRLAERYGEHLIAEFHGGLSDKERMKQLDEFQANLRRFQLANIAAGGQSIDMHDLIGGFPRHSIINPSWNAINVIQSVGRPDRAHAKSDILTQFMFADRTIEVPICQRFQSRKDNIDTLNDGDIVPSERIFKIAAGMDI